MKHCVFCGAELNDDARFCNVCGARQDEGFDNAQARADPGEMYSNHYDDTSRSYSGPGGQRYPAERSDQKLFAVIGWIFGWIGFLIAALAGNRRDPFLRFWLNQMLVFDLFALIGFIPVIGRIWGLVMFIFWIIGLVSVCRNEMKPIPLLGNIHILN